MGCLKGSYMICLQQRNVGLLYLSLLGMRSIFIDILANGMLTEPHKANILNIMLLCR